MTEIYVPLTDEELKGHLYEEHYEYVCNICYQPIYPPFSDDTRKFVQCWGTYNYGCKHCDALIEGIPLKRKK